MDFLPLLAAETPPDDFSDFRSVWALLLDSVQNIYAGFVKRLPHILTAAIILVVTLLLIRFGIHGFGKKLLRRTRLRQSLQVLILQLAGTVAWVVGLTLAAIVIFPNLNIAQALGAAGLASVAIGFAFKDIFQNFFAGVMLLWKFPFEPGDFIECGDVRGRVEDSKLRLTTIRQPDGQLVVVPNSQLIMNPVTVVTSKPKRRVSLMTGVAYGEDVTTAVDVIRKSLDGCRTIAQDEDIHVVPVAFGSSSIDIEVLYWTGSSPMDIRLSKGEVVTAVKKALDDAGIEIPFPYRTLTFAEPLTLARERDDMETA